MIAFCATLVVQRVRLVSCQGAYGVSDTYAVTGRNQKFRPVRGMRWLMSLTRELQSLKKSCCMPVRPSDSPIPVGTLQEILVGDRQVYGVTGKNGRWGLEVSLLL